MTLSENATTLSDAKKKYGPDTGDDAVVVLTRWDDMKAPTSSGFVSAIAGWHDYESVSIRSPKVGIDYIYIDEEGGAWSPEDLVEGEPDWFEALDDPPSWYDQSDTESSSASSRTTDWGSVSGSLFADEVLITRRLDVSNENSAPDSAIVKSDEDGLYYEIEFTDLPRNKLTEEEPFLDEAVNRWQELSGDDEECACTLFNELAEDHDKELARSIVQGILSNLTEQDPQIVNSFKY